MSASLSVSEMGIVAQFTQLDMEMSFMDQEAIMQLSEELIATIFDKVILSCSS